MQFARIVQHGSLEEVLVYCTEIWKIVSDNCCVNQISEAKINFMHAYISRLPSPIVARTFRVLERPLQKSGLSE